MDKNYRVDAVISVDGQHYTCRMSIKDAAYCPVCGKGFKPGYHTVLVPKGNTNVIELCHEHCVPAWKRPAIVGM